MIRIKMLKGVLVFLLIVAVTLTIGPLYIQQQTSTLVLLGDSSVLILASPFLKSAFADHGQEVTLTLHNSSFGSLTSGGGNQVSVFAEYVLNDNAIAEQTINAVMEVYGPNGTLIRTSSFPDGFISKSSGGVEGLETTIKDPSVQSVIAYVAFRNLDKTEVLSNTLRVDLNLAEDSTSPTMTGEDVGEEKVPGLESESESALETSPPLQTGQEDDDEVGDTEDEGEDESENGEWPPPPIFGNG